MQLRPLQQHFSWYGSVRPVYTTSSFRTISPCQLTLALAGPVFSHLWNPYLTFPEFTILRTPLHRAGDAHIEDSQISGIWTHSDHKPHINCLELKAVILALHHWVTVLRGHQVMIAMENTPVSFLYQQTGRDPFPYHVMSSSGSFSMASIPGHCHQ